jgi:hypothetical protein
MVYLSPSSWSERYKRSLSLLFKSSDFPECDMIDNIENSCGLIVKSLFPLSINIISLYYFDSNNDFDLYNITKVCLCILV